MCGFFQERAVQTESGCQVGERLLFFGCRLPEADYLYSDGELAEKQGVVEVLVWRNLKVANTFNSRFSSFLLLGYADVSASRVRDIAEALNKGASFFTYGSVAKGTKTTLVEIIIISNYPKPWRSLRDSRKDAMRSMSLNRLSPPRVRYPFAFGAMAFFGSGSPAFSRNHLYPFTWPGITM
ncbi:hypothetical protein C8R45DRAFT_628030 [Mycena sanguinolenta]|nr:hypothetical protein C8R45DRAFT_628030 [Mycena sanguinolenta]